MRIISKFKDYYDGVQYYGQDQDLVYVRNKEYPDEKFDMSKHTGDGWRDDYPHPSLKDIDKLNTCKYYGTFVLGFCGKLYRGQVIEVTTKKNIFDNFPIEKYIVCYNKEQIEPYLYKYEPKSKRGVTYRNMFHKGEGKNDLFKIENTKEMYELFFKYKVPCFIISDGKLRHQFRDQTKYKTNITINPQLGKYEFYKVKDAYITFQDISMYISGVLGVGAPVTVDISNKSMAEKKGFGHRYAFRKEPENKEKIK